MTPIAHHAGGGGVESHSALSSCEGGEGGHPVALVALALGRHLGLEATKHSKHVMLEKASYVVKVLHKRILEIEGKLENLARYVARTGDVDGAVNVRSDLRRDRSRLQIRLAARPKLPDRDHLRKMAAAKVREIRSALEGNDDQRRTALHALLRGRYFRVGSDPERLFKVTGEVQVGPIRPPTRWGAEWGVDKVAGGAMAQSPASSCLAS